MNSKKTSLVLTFVLATVLVFAGSAFAANVQTVSQVRFVDADEGANNSGLGKDKNDPYRTISFALKQVDSNVGNGKLDSIDTDVRIFVDDGTQEFRGRIGENFPMEIELDSAFVDIIFVDFYDDSTGSVTLNARNDNNVKQDVNMLDVSGSGTFKFRKVDEEWITNNSSLGYVDNTFNAIDTVRMEGTKSDSSEGAGVKFNDALTDHVVEGITFYELPMGILFDGIEPDDFTIKDNEFFGASGVGVEFTGGADVSNLSGDEEFSTNYFEGLETGVILGGNVDTGNNWFDIYNNEFYDNSNGIYVGTDVTDLGGLAVVFNKFEENEYGAKSLVDFTNNPSPIFNYNWWGPDPNERDFGPYNGEENKDGNGDKLTGYTGTSDDGDYVSDWLEAWTSKYWFSHEPDFLTADGAIKLESSSPGIGFNVFNDISNYSGDATEAGALNNASSDDTVYVEGGNTYSVSDDTRLVNTGPADTVKIIRSGGDRETTVLDGTWVKDNNNVDDQVVRIDNDNDQLGASGSGLKILGPDGSANVDNSVVFVTPNLSKVTIEGNEIRNGNHGILVARTASQLRIADNDIFGDWEVGDGTFYGIHINGADASSLVQNNYVESVGIAGIKLLNADVVTIRGNIITDIEDFGEGAPYYQTVGIWLIDEYGPIDDVTVEGNEITNVKDVDGDGVGIALTHMNIGDPTHFQKVYIEGRNTKGNIIENNDLGVALNYYSFGTEIPRFIFINENNIAGNSQYGVYSDNQVRYYTDAGDLKKKPLNAMLNWWGDSTGPEDPDQNPDGKGDKTNEWVNVLGWSTSPLVGPTADPTADFSADPTSGDAPLTVNFDASASKDNDESGDAIVEYKWDFDDDGNYDATTTSATTSHEYTSTGTYSVTLQVTDDEGATDTTTKGDLISVGEEDETKTFSAGSWYLMSIPLEADPDSCSDVIGDDLPTGTSCSDFVFHWDGTQYLAPSNVSPFEGYWLYADEELDVGVTGSEPSNKELVLNRTGWHMISSPKNIDWGEVQIKDSGSLSSYESIKDVDFTASGAPLANGIFRYDPSVPDYVGSTQPDWDDFGIFEWFGYWVNVPSDADTPVTLKFEADSSVTPPQPPSPSDSTSAGNGVVLSAMTESVPTPPPVPIASVGEGPLEVAAYQNTTAGSTSVTFAVTGEEARAAEGMKVQVQDVEGQQVFSAESSSTRLTWDAEGVSNGVYVYVASVKKDGTYEQTNVSKLLILK